jgi:hypothetical protein
MGFWVGLLYMTCAPGLFLGWIGGWRLWTAFLAFVLVPIIFLDISLYSRSLTLSIVVFVVYLLGVCLSLALMFRGKILWVRRPEKPSRVKWYKAFLYISFVPPVLVPALATIPLILVEVL